MSKLHRIPDDQVLALYTWMKHHKFRWRTNLRDAWYSGKYGVFSNTDTAAALQRLRNGLTSPMFIEKTTESAIRARVHHIHLTYAAQSLLDKLNAGQGNVFTIERVTLQGILQEAPAHYDRDL